MKQKPYHTEPRPLELHYSLALALDVVRRVKVPRYVSDNSEIAWVESWSNGREQGVSIRVLPRGDWPGSRINVAQSRGGESIFIIHGPDGEFDYEHGPSEKLWNTDDARKYFPNGQRARAAQYITRLINKIIKASEPMTDAFYGDEQDEEVRAA